MECNTDHLTETLPTTSENVGVVKKQQQSDFSSLTLSERVLPLNQALSKLDTQDFNNIASASTNLHQKKNINPTASLDILAAIGRFLNERY